jgi:hypothetical protein
MDVTILHLTRNGITVVYVTVNNIWQDFALDKYRLQTNTTVPLQLSLLAAQNTQTAESVSSIFILQYCSLFTDGHISMIHIHPWLCDVIEIL